MGVTVSEKGRVSLVVISHSEKLAEGVRELAQQMAPDVAIFTAGGRDDGGIGTSFDKASDACEDAAARSGGAGVVVLTDLGSANMVAESVIEFTDNPDEFALVDAPLVESAVVAAVAAQQQVSLEEVVDQVRGASRTSVQNVVSQGDVPEFRPDVSGSATVADPGGLHARPAAELVKMASVFDAEIWINGADAKSLMEVIALGRKCGDSVTVYASGPQANEAVANLVAAIDAGFDR